MIKKIKNRIDSYQITKNFFVDVQYIDNMAEFYLYHKDFGIKQLMFGIEINKETDIKEMIEKNVEFSIFNYMVDIMDEDNNN